VLELRALAAEEPRRETARLEEALAIWREAESPLREARLRLVLALVTGAGRQGDAQRLRRALRAAGIRVEAARLAAGPLGALPLADEAPVAIRALGGFTVLRRGEHVALAEWRSKKARDLLQILVSRRGRPVPREFLMEALWPNEDRTKLGNRLSVALTALRAVLDPSREYAAEHFVRGDRQTVALDLANVAVDVEDFLADAEAGLEERARPLLADAEAAYAGDFLEEVYDDWAVSLREDVRARYIAVGRALADEAAGAYDYDAAASYLLRVLERDRYDERAHLELVRALSASRRHGDARRQYRTYVARMEEIGVEPAPFPEATRGAADGMRV
jgi:DNA-binding SARP family transcriptional activator